MYTLIIFTQNRKDEQLLKRRNVNIDLDPAPLSELNQPSTGMSIATIVEVRTLCLAQHLTPT